MTQQFLFDFLEAEALRSRAGLRAVARGVGRGAVAAGPLEIDPYRRGTEWDGGRRDRVPPRRKIAAALRRLLDSGGAAGRTLLVGACADPYPAWEAELGLTRGVWSQLAVRRGFAIRLRTRSPLLLRDLGLLREVASRHALRVEVPLMSRDEDVLAALEPGSPSAAERLGLLEELIREGFHAGLWLSPVVPALTDSLGDLEAVIRAARRRGARFVGWSALVLGAAGKELFLDRVDRIAPQPAGRLRRIYAGQDQPPVFCKRLIATWIRELKLKYGFEEADRWRANTAVPPPAAGFGGASAESPVRRRARS